MKELFCRPLGPGTGACLRAGRGACLSARDLSHQLCASGDDAAQRSIQLAAIQAPLRLLGLTLTVGGALS